MFNVEASLFQHKIWLHIYRLPLSLWVLGLGACRHDDRWSWWERFMIKIIKFPQIIHLKIQHKCNHKVLSVYISKRQKCKTSAPSNKSENKAGVYILDRFLTQWQISVRLVHHHPAARKIKIHQGLVVFPPGCRQIIFSVWRMLYPYIK